MSLRISPEVRERALDAILDTDPDPFTRAMKSAARAYHEMRRQRALLGSSLQALVKAAGMYDYAKEKPRLFTEDGSVLFVDIRDHVRNVIATSGAITMGRAIEATTTSSGDTWLMLACVDRMVEMRELREIKQGEVAGQDRVFVRGERFRP